MREIIHLNYDWYYHLYEEKHLNHVELEAFQKVNIPHHAVEIPFNHFNEKDLEITSTYIKIFEAKNEWEQKLVHIRFEAVAHQAKLYVNQKLVMIHKGGYTPFEAIINEYLVFGEQNQILVVVDSHEDLNIPPFGGVVDYLGYSGIYREVSIIITDYAYIKDCFIQTDGTKNLKIKIDFSEIKGLLVYKIKDREGLIITKGMVMVDQLEMTIQTSVDEPHLWDIDQPYLYKLELQYELELKLTDYKLISFGIRHAEFREDGFYLNHRSIKLLGLNRHQSYPYVGYAMPKSAQEDDADQLKYELGVNIVRTSHYPQSSHFLNRCDEIGLLVFEEIPGWQYIGDQAWQDISLKNVEEMILRDRNHPSIILWGVRINESPDHHVLYTKTNHLARSLDPTRQTGGVRNMQFSDFLEDVYTYNDFSHTGTNKGLDEKKKVTKNYPYLVTEYNGHMFPTKPYDSETHRLNHALRHLNVINEMMDPNNGISGSIGWCMFDYNTHQEFGSGDKICYHGVLDMFRRPKLASYAYASQQDKYPVLEVSSTMNIGEHPGGLLESVTVLTNLDYVKMYKNEQFVGTYYPDVKRYPNLLHAPIVIDDFIGQTLEENEKMSHKDAETTKKVLKAVTTYGNNIPFRYKIKMSILLKKYKLSMADATKLFYKYMSGWGTNKISYRIEGYKNNELAKTIVKENNISFKYIIDMKKNILTISETYDVLKVNIKKVNQQNEVLPYAFDPVHIDVKGSIELIGPHLITLQNGMTSCWIKSKHVGKGKLIITIGSEVFETEVLVNEVKS